MSSEPPEPAPRSTAGDWCAGPASDLAQQARARLARGWSALKLSRLSRSTLKPSTLRPTARAPSDLAPSTLALSTLAPSTLALSTLALSALALWAPAAAASGAGAMREAGAITLGGQSISAVAIRPDGRQVAAVTEAQGGTLALVDVQPALVLRKTARLAATSDVALRFSPDGRWVTVNSIDARLYDVLALIDTDSGAVLTKLPVNGRQPPALAFSPDGRWLAVHTRERTLTVLDLHSSRRSGILARLLAWLRSAPAIAAQVLPLAVDGVTALSFSPNGERLRVHSRGRVLELSAPEFRPERGQALTVLHSDAWVAVCGGGTVAEFLGSDNAVLFRYGPWFLARPDVDPGPLGTRATALPFEARTIRALTLRGHPLTAWCDEARGRLYVLTDSALVAWDTGAGTDPLQRIAYPPWADRIGSRLAAPVNGDWHAARNPASEIVVLSLATGREVGWIAGASASDGGTRATAAVRFAADSGAGLLVTGAGNGMLRLWRPSGAAR